MESTTAWIPWRHSSPKERAISIGMSLPAATAASAADCVGSDGEHSYPEEEPIHRGTGGLVRGRAVFCLPPDSRWFQGHFAYAARGGCTASVGVLASEMPVDPCMQCCHGGFARYRLTFIHHELGKEAAIVVEKYGGNMMSLHAESTLEE
ncbi:unnamed protein product, partial [Discosporangium mesarthrocarpum]